MESKNVVIIKGQPIPAKRVTGRTLWKAKAYADYKEYVAWELKKQVKPSDLCRLEATGTVSIESIRFYREKRRTADLDNLLKGILEAFQMSGLVANDAEITHIEHLSVHYNAEEPRVEITLAPEV